MVVSSPVGDMLVRMSIVVLLICGASAQTPLPPSASISSPAPAARVPLDQTVADLGQIDADLLKQMTSLGALIDTEATAKHVSEPIAQSLRWSLRNLQPSSGTDFGTILNASRLPVENATLMDAIKTLDSQWAGAQQQRTALLQAAIVEARLRVAETAKTAENVGDVDPLLATLTRLLENAQNRNAAVGSASNSSNYTHLITFLRALRRVLELTPGADPVNVSSDLQAFVQTMLSSPTSGTASASSRPPPMPDASASPDVALVFLLEYIQQAESDRNSTTPARQLLDLWHLSESKIDLQTKLEANATGSLWQKLTLSPGSSLVLAARERAARERLSKICGPVGVDALPVVLRAQLEKAIAESDWARGEKLLAVDTIAALLPDSEHHEWRRTVSLFTQAEAHVAQKRSGDARGLYQNILATSTSKAAGETAARQLRTLLPPPSQTAVEAREN